MSCNALQQILYRILYHSNQMTGNRSRMIAERAIESIIDRQHSVLIFGRDVVAEFVPNVCCPWSAAPKNRIPTELRFRPDVR